MSGIDLHYGQAGHFICADRCRFHLHTHVGVSARWPRGRWCVSTVGEYYASPNDKKPTDLGGLWPDDRPGSQTYETMVFKLGSDGETADPSEKDGRRYADRDAANAGHVWLCGKWRKKR